MLIFQSTLPGWGATGRDSHDAYIASISIHAPRMGSDATTFRDFNNLMTFQSTLPGWGATG